MEAHFSALRYVPFAALLGIMTILGALIVGCEIEATSVPATAKPQSAVVVTAEKLLDDYEANEVRAKGLYEDKLLEITGTVESITEVLGQHTLRLEKSDTEFSPLSISCSIPDDRVSQLLNLSTGQRVTVQGYGDGLALFSVDVRDCLVVAAHGIGAGSANVVAVAPTPAGSSFSVPTAAAVQFPSANLTNPATPAATASQIAPTPTPVLSSAPPSTPARPSEAVTPFVPTATPPPTPVAKPKLGTRENPVPLGQTVEVNGGTPGGHWEITVIKAIPDATELVLSEGQFADPPAAGNQFFVARVRIKYLGAGSVMPLLQLSFKAVGDGGVVYGGLEDSFSCGTTVPEALKLFSEVFTNGQLEGNVCFEISQDDASSLVFFAQLGLFDGTRVWFSLTG